MKAIFIDGPSLHHMGHEMGIGQFNLHALNKFLTEEVGAERELADRIFVTVTPAMGKNAGRLWRNADFEVLETVSTDSLDDRLIIQRIVALDPEKLKEVILVSTDQDYIAALRRKAKQGIKVWWVGSLVNGHNDTPLMSTSLKPFLGTEFAFVDLYAHKDQLMALPKKMPAATRTDVPVRTLKIELSGAKSHAEHLAVLSTLTRLLGKYPCIKYKIEG